MKRNFASFDLKISAFEANQEELRESLRSIPKLCEVKDLFDAFMQHQQESIRQQQQETLRHREQQQQQLQQQQSMLKHQQHLLEEQQRQMALQREQLKQLVVQNHSNISSPPPSVAAASLDAVPATVQACSGNLPSAPPMSVELDDFVRLRSNDDGSI